MAYCFSMTHILIRKSLHICRAIQGHQNGMTNDNQYNLCDNIETLKNVEEIPWMYSPKLKTLIGSVKCVMYTTIKPCDITKLWFSTYAACPKIVDKCLLWWLFPRTCTISDNQVRGTLAVNTFIIDLCHVFHSNFTFVLTLARIYSRHYYGLSMIVIFRCFSNAPMHAQLW